MKSNNGSEKVIQPKLSIPDEWNVSQEERYIYQFEHNKLKPLPKNSMTIQGISVNESAKYFSFKAFISHTLNEQLRLGEKTIVILDGNNNILAKATFDLSKLGSLPPASSRPWVFRFSKKSITSSHKIKSDKWILAFQLDDHQKLDIHQSQYDDFTLDELANIREVFDSSNSLKKGEVQLTTVASKFNSSNQLELIVLIRNGSDKKIPLTRLPIRIKEQDKVIAESLFNLNGLLIKGYTSKPWRFKFPMETIKGNVNQLENCKVEVIQ